MTNKQLPLFVDDTVLPTGKNHISYSELIDWKECSYRHKLKHVQKLNMDGPSVHTVFGHVLHSALESYVLTGIMPPIEEIKLEFEKGVAELFFTEKAITVEEAKEFLNVIEPLLEQAPKALDEEFPGWQIVAAEEQLFETIEGQTNKHFKGFIDLVIKVPKRKQGKTTSLSGLKGETVDGEWEYYIIDWKTTNTGWQNAQKNSFSKRMQLVFYRHFWSKKRDIDPEKVKCAFAFLRRTPQKTGQRIEFLHVDVNLAATEKAMEELRNALNQIQSGFALKNKMSCMFCPYKHTVHCP